MALKIPILGRCQSTSVLQNEHISIGILTHFAHSDVVKPVGAVEDDTLDSERFCQIFGRLSLTSTSRTFWRAVQMKMERTHQRSIAAVSQWRYHQPGVHSISPRHFQCYHSRSSWFDRQITVSKRDR